MTNIEWYVANSSKLIRRQQHRFSYKSYMCSICCVPFYCFEKPFVENTFFKSFPPKKPSDYESQKSGFGFDPKNPPWVWILWIHYPFLDSEFRIWIFPKKRTLTDDQIKFIWYILRSKNEMARKQTLVLLISTYLYERFDSYSYHGHWQNSGNRFIHIPVWHALKLHLLECTEGPTQGLPPLQVRERLLYPTPQDTLHRDHCPQDEYHPCTESERRKRRVSSIWCKMPCTAYGESYRPFDF